MDSTYFRCSRNTSSCLRRAVVDASKAAVAASKSCCSISQRVRVCSNAACLATTDSTDSTLLATAQYRGNPQPHISRNGLGEQSIRCPSGCNAVRICKEHRRPGGVRCVTAEVWSALLSVLAVLLLWSRVFTSSVFYPINSTQQPQPQPQSCYTYGVASK
jgi:hypothetical protein